MYWLFIGVAIGLLVGAVVASMVSRRSMARFRTAERRARQAERMAEIGAMTGGLAHEIKNPLSTIGLNAQLLAEGIDELAIDQDHKRRLGNRVGALRREAERLRGVLQDFLEFAGQVRLAPQAADMNVVVGELVDFFQPEAERQGVRLRMDAAPGTLSARFDVKLIKQALLNLMLNSVQAMAPARASEGASGPGSAGELILRTRSVEEKGRAGAGVCVSVIDTGPGMTPEVMGRVFSPYFTTKAGGSGLGLPTARRLVEEHGGRLDVHSEVGKGTVFTVVLPLAPRDVESPSGAETDRKVVG
ncbi:MAG: two-component system sensor histidine kinase NtrB [Phycisphaerales bacterium]